jgi:hypothetical protein
MRLPRGAEAGGQFVFSLLHPCFEEAASAWPGRDHVRVREYLAEHATTRRCGVLFHRPLSSSLNLLVELA